ncbi:MAG: hypothetical protein GY799_29045, partial [Desulfobulbaceae bacterium]|nr:hypothetical protein [Desulfobulbaceae bacterium]
LYETHASTESSDTLTVSNVQVTDEVEYHCVVEGTAGTTDAESTAAVLWTERLIGEWTFDGETLADSVASTVAGAPAHDGVYVDPNELAPAPTAVYDANGISGKALQLADDVFHVEIADPNFFGFYVNGYTVNAWVKSADLSSWMGIVSKKGDSDYGYQISQSGYLEGGGIQHILRINGSAVLDILVYDGLLSLDTWHMVTGSYSGASGVFALYIDGVMVRQYIDTTPAVTEDGIPVLFGATNSDGILPFNGSLDEITIWSYAKDKYVIAQIYADASGLVPCVDDPGAEDLSGDCKVNLVDFAMMAAKWLDDGNVYPQE